MGSFSTNEENHAVIVSSSQEENEMVICFAQQEDSPWQSDTDSDTSTPGYKRGKHGHVQDQPEGDRETALTQQAIDEITREGQQCKNPSPSREKVLTLQAVREILRDGISWKEPLWITRRRRTLTSTLHTLSLPGQKPNCLSASIRMLWERLLTRIFQNAFF